jgi:hypothetical protein
MNNWAIKTKNRKLIPYRSESREHTHYCPPITRAQFSKLLTEILGKFFLKRNVQEINFHC